MNIIFTDTETLSGLERACNGQKQMLDSIGMLSFSGNYREILTGITSNMSALVENALNVESRDLHDIPLGNSELQVVSYYEFVDVLSQLAAGREFSLNTHAFHLKNGYVPEKVSDRKLVRDVLTTMGVYTTQCDTLYCRGTDFDIPLIASLFAEHKVKFMRKYNLIRDMRTYVDSRVSPSPADVPHTLGYLDFKNNTYDVIPVGKGNSAEVARLTSMLTNLKAASEALDGKRHTALVDATLEALNFAVLEQIHIAPNVYLEFY